MITSVFRGEFLNFNELYELDLWAKLNYTDLEGTKVHIQGVKAGLWRYEGTQYEAQPEQK